MNMISKYDDFILEQALMMINESEVVYSSKFRNLLKEIESPVAKSLVDMESKDLKVVSNYFDIADNKDTISFISDRKAQEIIGENKYKYVIFNDGNILTHNIEQNGRIFGLLGYVPNGEAGYTPDDGERGEVIKKAISPSSGKTYLYLKFERGECVTNEQNVTYDENTEIWSKNRQSVRTGRGIKALLNAAGYSFKDSEIEDFVNKYKSAFDRMNDVFRDFKLVSGNDISHWYDYRNYLHLTDRGTLGNSCMATVPSSFFQIYTKNPNVCSLLILRSADNPDKIKGRALVWKLSEPDIIFVDRVYTHDDSDIQLFRDYAKHKKWSIKKRNDSSSEATVISPDGTDVNYDKLSVEIENIEYTKFPYVDTLKYFYDNQFQTTSKSKLSTDSGARSSMCLESTNGGYDGSECDNCGGEGRVDCYDCDGRGRVDCEECDGNGTIDCRECDGDGKVDCGECDGKGKDKNGVECRDCKGGGTVDCAECYGKGEMQCSECEGNGRHTCNRCDGDGTIDCPDCN